MTTDYQLIVFDWDGTLMDSEAHIVECMQAALTEMSVEPLPAAHLRQFIGLGLREALAAVIPEQDDSFYDQLTTAYRQHYLGSQAGASQLFDGAEALLYGLADAGYLLGVATGKSRRGLQRNLDETGLGPLFAATRCADEARSKPAPDMLQAILQELDVAPDKTLVVGDTEFDMLMARAAGCDGLAVSYGVHDRERLHACRPVHLADSIDELSGWFGLGALSQTASC